MDTLRFRRFLEVHHIEQRSYAYFWQCFEKDPQFVERVMQEFKGLSKETLMVNIHTVRVVILDWPVAQENMIDVRIDMDYQKTSKRGGYTEIQIGTYYVRYNFAGEFLSEDMDIAWNFKEGV